MTGSDWIAIAGILGTLLGTGLGAFIAWRLQRDSLAHEDRTRFHSERLKTYSEYLASLDHLVACFASELEPGDDATDAFVTRGIAMGFLGSHKILALANECTELVKRLGFSEGGQCRPSPSEIARFHEIRGEFLVEVRDQLSVDARK